MLGLYDWIVGKVRGRFGVDAQTLVASGKGCVDLRPAAELVLGADLAGNGIVAGTGFAARKNGAEVAVASNQDTKLRTIDRDGFMLDADTPKQLELFKNLKFSLTECCYVLVLQLGCCRERTVPDAA